MALTFGIHTGPQDCSYADLRRAWRFADTSGFEWCSVWDHFYSLAHPSGPCLEGTAAMTALGAVTERVRVGCLVFCVCYRHPAVIANAAATIDHISGGRCELGIGAGWYSAEAEALGIPFPPIGDRLDRLEEAAQVIRSLLTQERTTFEGRQFQLNDAYCEPKPIQRRLRLWIGGQGEKRLLRIVARHADAWNVPFLSPEVYAERNRTLDRWCERERRNPAEILRTVNVGLAIGGSAEEAARQEADLPKQFGPTLPLLRGGVVVGTPRQVIDRLGEYERAGAQWVIVALRPPFDWEGLERFAADVMPAFRGA